MPDALKLDAVSKHYDGHRAVDKLSLSVPAGSIYGILGPNGAGKSSIIRAALNIIARDDGRVELLGVDPAENPAVLRRVGYLPEERGLYRGMRVLDVVVFFGRLKGLTGREAKDRAEQWLDRLGLTDWRKSRVDGLSKGMQQKVQFAATVLHQPELVFLDEPAAGLDPVNQDVLRETIREVRSDGRTVVFSTHTMAEAEELCDRVCIIAGGRKILDGDLDAIRRSHRGNRWIVEYDGEGADLPNLLARFPVTTSVERTRRGWIVDLGDASPRDLLTGLWTLDEVPSRVEHIVPTLHEIFVKLVGPEAAKPTRVENVDA